MEVSEMIIKGKKIDLLFIIFFCAVIIFMPFMLAFGAFVNKDIIDKRGIRLIE